MIIKFDHASTGHIASFTLHPSRHVLFPLPLTNTYHAQARTRNFPWLIFRWRWFYFAFAASNSSAAWASEQAQEEQTNTSRKPIRGRFIMIICSLYYHFKFYNVLIFVFRISCDMSDVIQWVHACCNAYTLIIFIKIASCIPAEDNPKSLHDIGRWIHRCVDLVCNLISSYWNGFKITMHQSALGNGQSHALEEKLMYL